MDLEYDGNENPSSDSGNGDYTTASQSVEGEKYSETSELIVDDSTFQTDDKETIIQYVHDLKFKDKREKALAELSKKREFLQDLAPVIWHSVGTISALLQEIISIYPYLSPSAMTTALSNRAWNVLGLLQCVAAHPETRTAFLKANIPLFLYPFLNTIIKGRPYEYLRLTSLGVIGALVKIDDPEVINFLLHTEIIPLSLRIMERGTELSQTVATFIIQKILSDANGLNYICQTKQRFYTVVTVMDSMVLNQKQTPSQRLLKHIARCYQKLFENQKAKEWFVEKVPSLLNEKCLEDQFDDNTKAIVNQMKEIIKNWNNESLNMMGQNPGYLKQPRMVPSQPTGVYPQMDPNGKGKMMNPGMTGIMPGMDNSIGGTSGRNSTGLKQPVYSRPNSTTNYAYNNQMYNRAARPFVPAVSTTSHPFSRPGSSQAHMAPLSSSMASHNLSPSSPPPMHQPSQPVMMQYINPIPMNQTSMMRMSHNQSPYYPSMVSQPAQYHPASMMSPVSEIPTSGMMTSHGMYMAPMGTTQGYRIAQPRAINPTLQDNSSNM